jgi:uncharacterized protein YyaL (SSP411 family)
MVDQFWDADQGGFFFVGRDHEDLLVRGKEPHDGATPSGNSMAALALLRLSKLTGRTDLEDKAARTLQVFRDLMADAPTAAGQMLVALDYHLGPVEEFAIVGPRSSPAVRQALQLVQHPFRPRKVVALRDNENLAQDVSSIALLTGKKPVDGDVATYICRNMTCEAPLIGDNALRDRLTAGGAPGSPRTQS